MDGQRHTWTAREEETYAEICALRKWSGHIGLQPIFVCTDNQSLQSSNKEHGNTPLGPAADALVGTRRYPSLIVYLPGKDNTVARCPSRGAYLAEKAWIDISMHGDAEDTVEAKRIIKAERLLEEGGAKCFVVMGARAELPQF